MQLLLFASVPAVVAPALAGGVAGVVVDWERRGKERRQAGSDTQIGVDGPDDLARARALVPPDRSLLCRVDAWGPGAADQVELALLLGADEVLLPMVRRVEEVDAALDLVDGRAGLGVLVETQDAVDDVAAIGSRPLSRVYLGLNDLRIDRGVPEGPALFEPLLDGTVDRVRAAVRCPLGAAGLTLPGRGRPVPSRHVAGALVTAGVDFAFLRRSFLADGAADYRAAVRAVTALADDCRARCAGDVAEDLAALAAAVREPLLASA